MTYRVLIVITFSLALGSLGCNSEPTLQTEFVEGVVTLDGSPVPDATVTFLPAVAGQGIAATGTTDASGVYTLTAMPPSNELQAVVGAGTVPGKYTVVVRKVEAPKVLSQEEAERQGLPYQYYEPGTGPKPKFIVPKKYLQPDTSDITVDVAPGKNAIPLELYSK